MSFGRVCHVMSCFLHRAGHPETTGGGCRETKSSRGERSGYRKDHKRRNRYRFTHTKVLQPADIAKLLLMTEL